ncbi:MAG: hypothetical protein ACR2MQ_16200 [Gemmatimonadaceae bacterium]
MTNPALRYGARLSALWAVVFLGACGHELSAPTQQPASQFSATVTGAFQIPLTGKAALITSPAGTLGSTPVPASSVLGLMDKNGTVVAFKWAGPPPIAGSYDIGLASNDIVMSYDQATGSPGSSFEGTTGTVIISSATDTYVSGTFFAAATAQDTQARITVTGSFTAQVVPQTPM